MQTKIFPKITTSFITLNTFFNEKISINGTDEISTEWTSRDSKHEQEAIITEYSRLLRSPTARDLHYNAKGKFFNSHI